MRREADERRPLRLPLEPRQLLEAVLPAAGGRAAGDRGVDPARRLGAGVRGGAGRTGPPLESRGGDPT